MELRKKLSPTSQALATLAGNTTPSRFCIIYCYLIFPSPGEVRDKSPDEPEQVSYVDGKSTRVFCTYHSEIIGRKTSYTPPKQEPNKYAQLISEILSLCALSSLYTRLSGDPGLCLSSKLMFLA